MADSGGRGGALTVAVAHHPVDAERAATLAAFLERAGMSVRELDGSLLDGVVVLLSAPALRDPGWLENAKLEGRLVPVRLGTIDGLDVPHGLSDLNYLDWLPGTGEALQGRVLAALATDPDSRDFLRRLTRDAQAWQDAGQPSQLLIQDRKRGRQAAGILRDADREATALSPVTRAFVARSAVELRRRRRAGWRKAAGLAGAAVLLVGVASVVWPQMRLAGRNNHSAITLTGDPDTLVAMPEWTAVNSAAVLLNGSTAQRQLARATLLSAMALPWSVSALQSFRAVDDAVPFDGGRRAVVSFEWHGATNVAVLDVRTTQIAWTASLAGEFPYVSVTPDGRALVASGSSGIAVLDLTTRAVRKLPGAAGTTENVPIDGEHAAVLNKSGVEIVDLGTGSVTKSLAYPSVAALAAPASLVRDDAGHPRLIDLATNRTLAVGSAVPYAADGTGSVAPDGRHAVVEGTDGQVWTFGVGAPATPTGIPVRYGQSALLWTSGNRIVVSSYDVPAEVYLLTGAVGLGTMCDDLNQMVAIRPVAGSDVTACISPAGISFYRLPAGPRAAPRHPGSRQLSVTAGSTTIRADGGSLKAGTQDPVPVVSGRITAMAASPDGTEVVVGSSTGDSGVVTVYDGRIGLTTRKIIPSQQPVTEAGWSDGPYVTAGGQSWAVPECAGCDTDAGLLDAFRARITGCFNHSQLGWIDDKTRRALGVHECAAQIGG
jgi:WD40 repeat protein